MTGPMPTVDGRTLLRKAGPTDYGDLADLYADCLSNDLAVALGRAFCIRLFQVLIADSGTVVSVVERDRAIVGFCALSSARRQINRQLLPHALAALLFHPGVALRTALQAVRPSFLRSFFGREDATTDGWREVYLIGVSRSARCSGLGGLVLRHAIETDPSGPPCMAKTLSAQAVAFYERHGFISLRHERRGNRTLTVLGTFQHDGG